MSYVIEEGVPLPSPTRGGGRPPGPASPWIHVLASMAPGQSVLTESHAEARAAENYATRSRVRRYAVRKVNGQGWRIWRVE